MKLSKTNTRIFQAAVIAAGSLWALGTAQALPEVNVQILASTTNGSGYSSSLTGVQNGQTVYYEVIAQSAPSGTANTNAGSKKPNGITDYLNTFPALQLLNGTNGNGTFETSALGSVWVNGTGSTAGTTGSNTITIYGTATNAPNDDTAVTLATGSYVVGSVNSALILNDLLKNSQSGYKVGGIHLGGTGIGNSVTITTTSETSSDPLVGLAGVQFNDVWDGTTNANWDVSSNNWNNGTAPFTNGAGAIFGNYAANGTTPVNANNTVIAIQQSGVLPASTVFSNTSSTPYRFTTTGSVGIGTGSVTINGGGTVAFSNTNTYTGGTFITDGTLKAAAGSLATTGAVTIGSQGELSVGDGTTTAVGTLHTGAQIWTAGGTLGVKLNGDGTNDQVAIGGALTLTGSGTPFTISVAPGASSITTSEQYEVATFTSLAGYTGTQPTADSGSAGAVTVPTGSNEQFALNTSAISGIPSGDFSLSLESLSNGTGDALFVDVDYSSTPEPTTALLGLTAVAPMLMARRRRNRAANQA